LAARTIHISILFSFLSLLGYSVHAQYKIKGNVYDSTRLYPLSSVSVLSSAGRGTVTDANGYYEIDVSEKDSIWFSYLGKPTIKYSVLKITDPQHFDISIQIYIPVLREVKVMQRNYRLDSIQNRIDYEKAFNFHRPTVGSMTSIGPTGAGIDIDELIRAFQFRKNRMAAHFQERLLQQERDKYVENKFSKGLVLRLTGLTGDERDTFMMIYRPSFEFTQRASDYEFQSYIKLSFRNFRLTHPALKPEAQKGF
jgi:hypothetical protein